MPRISVGYASKRKIVKRYKRVARRRRAGVQLAGARDQAGINNNPFLSLSNRVSSKNTFPPSMRRTVKYCEMITVTSGNQVLGGMQAYVINSIYDPNLSGGGHQPYGHDTYATLYNKYRVLGVRAMLVFTTPGGAHDMVCVSAPSSNTSSSMSGLNLWQVQEWPQSKCGILPAGGERKCVLQSTFDNATVAGVKKAAYMAGDEYEATIGSSPSKALYLSFAVGCVDGQDAQSCVCQVYLEYDVLFFDRTTLGYS